MHGILLIMVVSITIVSFAGVLIMSPMNSGSMQEYFGSPVDAAVFFAHCLFVSCLSVWTVALRLWRPFFPAFPEKHEKIAWLLTVFWVSSYIVGILGYLIIRIHLF
jgi:uncharacterized membrane protein YozB (DUF420 family)